MKTLKDININNKRVLIRFDYNVPIENDVVKDTFRLDASVETINYCLAQNASIIIISHLGRPKNNDPKLSVYPILDYLEEKFNVFVHYSDDCISKEAIDKSQKMLKNEIHLLENLRYYDEEISNDEVFAEKLSRHADVYINDAFGLSHRQHASNSSILKYFDEKCIGLLIQKEIKNLSTNIDKKTIVIIGGAKISTKINMINKYLGNASHILIGGAMAFTFMKAMGKNIGGSLYEQNMIDIANDIMNSSKDKGTNIVLPNDFVCSKDNSDKFDVLNSDNLTDSDVGYDIGPETSMNYSMIIKNSAKVIWNGPMGMFEKPEYATGTQAVCYEIKESTINNNLISIVGGGDTVRAIKSFTNTSDFTHVSTGGGASLKVLSGEKLDFVKSWELYDK